MMDNFNLEQILKKKENVVLFVIIIFSLLAGRVIYGKQSLRYEQIRLQIDTEREKGITLDRILILNEKIKKAKERSWDTLDINAIIDKIYQEGISSGIKIRTISPGARDDQKNYVLVSLTIESEATYKQFLKFIKGLENSKMLLTMQSVTFAPMGEVDGRSDPTLNGSISINAVYFK